MRIVAVIGSESHTTSAYWAKLFINGQRVSHREARSAEWQTKYGDKHASWCECVFEVAEGAEIRWEAGSNTGNRGANRERQSLIFRADSTAEVVEIKGGGGTLKGRLVAVVDRAAQAAQDHAAMIADL